MDIFNTLTLQDKETFNDYCYKSNFSSYEYTFASLYLWRNLSKTTFAIIDNTLIVKKSEEYYGDFFMIPYNYTPNKLNSIIELLLSYKKNNNNNSQSNFLSNNTHELYLFGDVENFFINDLKKYCAHKFEIVYTPEDYEYIYLTKDLINLSGKRYHAKKNLYNFFNKNYSFKISEINSPKIINDCLDLIKKWEKSKNSLCTELKIEYDVIRDVLINFQKLDLKSITIYVNDTLAGFSIGEKYGDTAIIHIERCDISFKGIYSFLNRTFLDMYFSDTLYVNRQEDCGDLGLRKSKVSYHPIGYIKKCFIKIID